MTHASHDRHGDPRETPDTHASATLWRRDALCHTEVL